MTARDPSSRDEPAPSYVGGPGSALTPDPRVHQGVVEGLGRASVVEELVIPVRDGRAWEVPAGHVCRFSIIEGPQVLDLNVWNRHEPRERFWASRTRQFYGAHVTTGHRLWSNLPFLRPLATVVSDSIGYGIDEDGAGCHDLLGTRCDPYVNRLLAGTDYDFHCHSNLVRAVLPWGLGELDVHDVINVFQVTGLRSDERYFMKPCPARVGDHFSLFAETDLLMAASACPGGDLSVPLWGPGSDAEPNCNPIGVQVLRMPEDALACWTPPTPPAYEGNHGLPPSTRPPLTASVGVTDRGG